MQLWSGPSVRFVRDTTQNQIAGMLTDAFFAQYRYRPSDGEINSWRNSLRATSLVFQEAGLNDHGVFLEYRLPLTSRRLDVMVCGTDTGGQDHAVIIELKQWEKCEDALGEHLVTTWVAGASREVLHPSAQVGQYQRYLEDTHTAFYEEPGPVGLASCAYLHNYPHEKDDILFAPRFKSLLASSPSFTMDDVSALKTFLVDRVGGGRGMPVLDRIQDSRYRPSKKLMDHVAGVIDSTAEYVLLDEQLVVFDKVLAIAKDGLGRRGKRVLIVKGGPGTGKSVIALNLMSRLLKEQFNAHYATGSKAFTETLRAVVGSRAGVQFKYFNSYTEAGPGEIDVLICDEAHRLRKTSGDRFRPSKTGKPQVQEVIEASRLPVFLIDDQQVVRPEEVGSSVYIRKEAERLGCEVQEHELEAQFRCAGSDAYVNWVTNTLGLARTANTIWEGDERFEFRIFPSPDELDKAIRARASQGFSARLTAGFCWKWSKESSDGSLVNDVQIGDWSRPWNAKHDAKRLAKGIPKAHLWAHEPGGLDQVGCIYTAQGFEFDYVGVIVGLDLRFDLDAQDWVGHRERSHDGAVRRGGDRFVDLVKNAYRVLMSRGMKGCYVHFLDRDTERFVRTRLTKGAADPRAAEFELVDVEDAEPSTPFRRLSPDEVQPFENCVPLYELAVAAGGFSDEQQSEAVPLGSEDRNPDAFTWVQLPDAFRHKRGLFVARVVGESMNRRIPNGAWCLFCLPAAGSRQGRVVVAQHRDINDSETGGHYTVKVYASRKRPKLGGEWEHEQIILRPDTNTRGFEPIVVPAESAEEVRIVAELVAVLPER